MNIQPISALNTPHANNLTKRAATPAFNGIETNKDNEKRLINAMKALAAASAIAVAPSVVSCTKVEIDEDCDHPNHVDPPFPSDSTDVDTVYTGKTFVTPEIKMQRYKVSGNDTTKYGSVTFSEGIVHVPYDAHKASELKTVLNFIDVLGLKTKNIDKEYVASRAFDYNIIPAQLTWLNEKNGTVNQLKYNGYESEDTRIKMDLISIPAEGKPVERRLELSAAGNDKLLVGVYDKEGKVKYTEKFFMLENDKVSQFDVKEGNKFVKVCEYSKGNNPTAISAKDTSGNSYKIANFDVLTAISEEK